MIKKFVYLVFSGVALIFAGCGEGQKTKETISRLNSQADTWDESKSFQTEEKDAWGKPLYYKITEGKLIRELVVGSPGPDGLPKNSDDLVVLRQKTVFSIEGAANAAVSGSVGGAMKGAVNGTKAVISSVLKKDNVKPAPAGDRKE